LAGPTAEVIRLVHIRMILPELLRRVGTFDAHAAHHAHFGTVGLSLGAVSDWQRDAGVVIGRICQFDLKRIARCAEARFSQY
jgi:hypothetical protein